ncbi:WYL domain-containing protein [Lacrimispora amygdalina]|uniref:WYL domain-containing protein n=1 Tax=Lacrimispora amygdalina TaxID=253257 RepID=A0ABQ5M5B4_9FIRM
MEKYEYDRKQERLLTLYTKLLGGEIICKKNEAEYFNVSSRSIQRDIDDLRMFLANRSVKTGTLQLLIYDKKSNGYRLLDNQTCKMTSGELLTLCKILLESRSLTKEELFPLIKKLLENCASLDNKRDITDLIANEKHHYIEPHHQAKIIDRIWNLGMAVRNQKYVEIEYKKLKNNDIVKRKVKPVGIMFSEYYFYLIAFIDVEKNSSLEKDELFPTIYRIDRIQNFTILQNRFSIPYKGRFEEGEFRKRVQFMFGGSLKRITFQYSGLSIEAVLDRLPTAQILEEKDNIYTVTAEVFGKGIDMWIRSQGESIKML